MSLKPYIIAAICVWAILTYFIFIHQVNNMYYNEIDQKKHDIAKVMKYDFTHGCIIASFFDPEIASLMMTNDSFHVVTLKEELDLLRHQSSLLKKGFWVDWVESYESLHTNYFLLHHLSYKFFRSAIHLPFIEQSIHFFKYIDFTYRYFEYLYLPSSSSLFTEQYSDTHIPEMVLSEIQHLTQMVNDMNENEFVQEMNRQMKISPKRQSFRKYVTTKICDVLKLDPNCQNNWFQVIYRMIKLLYEEEQLNRSEKQQEIDRLETFLKQPPIGENRNKNKDSVLGFSSNPEIRITL